MPEDAPPTRKQVAIRIVPDSLAAIVHGDLVSRGVYNVDFCMQLTSETDIVVTNDEQTLFDAIAEERAIIQIKVGANGTDIADIIIQKLKIV